LQGSGVRISLSPQKHFGAGQVVGAIGPTPVQSTEAFKDNSIFELTIHLLYYIAISSCLKYNNFMRIHSPEKIKKLKELRKKGYSINELVEELVIPKTTVWHHIHDISVPQKYAHLLYSKRGGSSKRKQKNIEMAKGKAVELLKSTDRESLIALAMLYWGEGSKGACEFINSNGKIIQLYLKIIRDRLDVSEASIKATMRIFSGMNKNDCLNYWSKITRVPRNKFIIRFNDGGTRGKTKYGMCRISIRKGDNKLKLIHALIDQIFMELMEKK
jgi:hypothetical protein